MAEGAVHPIRTRRQLLSSIVATGSKLGDVDPVQPLRGCTQLPSSMLATVSKFAARRWVQPRFTRRSS
eukprot:4117829-Prymnesium_polylepis.2